MMVLPTHTFLRYVLLAVLVCMQAGAAEAGFGRVRGQLHGKRTKPVRWAKTGSVGRTMAERLFRSAERLREGTIPAVGIGVIKAGTTASVRPVGAAVGLLMTGRGVVNGLRAAYVLESTAVYFAMRGGVPLEAMEANRASQVLRETSARLKRLAGEIRGRRGLLGGIESVLRHQAFPEGTLTAFGVSSKNPRTVARAAERIAMRFDRFAAGLAAAAEEDLSRPQADARPSAAELRRLARRPSPVIAPSLSLQVWNVTQSRR